MSASRQLPAFGLSVLVHIVLGLILVFGFRWDIPKPKPAVLELWSAPRPHVQVVDVPPPAPVKVVPQTVAPEPELARAEINLKRAEPVKPVKEKPEVKRQEVPTKVEKTPVKPEVKKPPPHKPVIIHPAPIDPLALLAGKLSQNNTPTSSPSKPTAAPPGADGSDVKQLADDYGQQIVTKIRKNYHVIPGTTSSGLSVEVLITVLSDGTLYNPTITRSSGNTAFDQSVLNAVGMTRKAPPPPKGLPYSVFRDTRIVYRP